MNVITSKLRREVPGDDSNVFGSSHQNFFISFSLFILVMSLKKSVRTPCNKHDVTASLILTPSSAILTVVGKQTKRVNLAYK